MSHGHSSRAREFVLCGSDFGRRRFASLRLLTGILLVVAACGKVGPPLPPKILIAERTSDLTAFQESGDAVLRWSYPSSTTSGEELPEIEAVEIWRAALPPGQEPPPPSTVAEASMQRQLLSSLGEVVAVLGPAEIEAATRGPDLVFRDDLRRWRDTWGPEPAVLWYGVRTFCCRKRVSEFSNIARLRPQAPPEPPTGLELEAGSEGVRVSWRQGDGLAALVERSRDGLRWSQVSDAPVTGGEWLDSTADQGRSWSYRLRSVLELDDGERVVGEPSAPVRVDHPDTYPPPAAEGIVCLPEGSRVRIRWQSVPGAVSYVVSRSRPGDDPVELADGLASVEFTDARPLLGDLVYEVVAIDEAGNRSPAASCSVTMGAAP